MKSVVRRLKGLFVSMVGWFTRPTPIKRSAQELKLLARDVKCLRVYDYQGCPETLKVRHALLRLNLDIQYCDIRKCQVHRDNLLSEFGRIHAPCLRIEENQSVRWLDEPEQIIHYLNQRFDPAQQQQGAQAA